MSDLNCISPFYSFNFSAFQLMKKRLYMACMLFVLLVSNKAKSQTVDSVFAYVCASGIQYPEIVMKQIILETGWLKTTYLMKRHNLFAFRYQRSYMRFPTWQASIDYYKQWQSKSLKTTDKDYYSFLVRIRYAASPVYIQTLKKIRFTKHCTQ